MAKPSYNVATKTLARYSEIHSDTDLNPIASPIFRYI
jgi:hypothetical protein